jgi:tetratricopeptide (TPR) repeat protein
LKPLPPLLLGLALAACANGMPDIRSLKTATLSLTPFERAYADGKGHLLAGRAGLAVVAFQKALAFDPASVAALNGLGAAYDDLRRYDIAQAYYARALLVAPDSADTTNNMAVSLRLANDPSAKDWFERAALLDPQNEVIAANLMESRSETSPLPKAALRDEAATDTSDERIDETRPRLERTGSSEYRVRLPLKRTDGLGRAVGIVAIQDATPVIAAIESNAGGQPVLDVANGVGRAGMARRVGGFLARNGMVAQRITNAPVYNCEKSVVYYRSGREADAERLVRLLPFVVTIEADDAMADDVRLLLGRDLLDFDRTL